MNIEDQLKYDGPMPRKRAWCIETAVRKEIRRQYEHIDSYKRAMETSTGDRLAKLKTDIARTQEWISRAEQKLEAMQ